MNSVKKMANLKRTLKVYLGEHENMKRVLTAVCRMGWKNHRHDTLGKYCRSKIRQWLWSWKDLNAFERYLRSMMERIKRNKFRDGMKVLVEIRVIPSV